MSSWTFTSESVTEGHPDKMADQISDAILDAMLEQDPMSRVACETFVTTGLAIVGGEITTNGYVDIPKVVRSTINEIGYNRESYGYDGNTVGVLVSLDEQSPDIAQGVDDSEEVRSGTSGEDLLNKQGAGDQGMMFGYACDETDVLMPLPIHLAHRMAERLAEVRRAGTVPYLRPDGKTQVTFDYTDGKPTRLRTVLISTQHNDGIDRDEVIRPDLIEHVIRPVVPGAVRRRRLRGVREPDRPVRDRWPGGRRRPDRPQDHRRHLRRHGPPRRRRLLGQGPVQGRPLGRLRGPLGGQERGRLRCRRRAARCRSPTPSAWPTRSRCMVETFGTETVDNASIVDAVDADLRPAPGGHPARPRPAPADLQADRGLRALRAARRGRWLHLGAHRQGRRPALGARALTLPFPHLPARTRPPRPTAPAGRRSARRRPASGGAGAAGPAGHRQDVRLPRRRALAGDIRVGTMVRVALHGRRVGGWVVEVGVEPPPGVTLTPIAKVTGWGPSADADRAGPLGGVAVGGSTGADAAHRLARHRGAGVLPPRPDPAGRRPAGPADELAAEALAAAAVGRAPGAGRGSLPRSCWPRPALGHALVLAPSAAAARHLGLRLRRAGMAAARHAAGLGPGRGRGVGDRHPGGGVGARVATWPRSWCSTSTTRAGNRSGPPRGTPATWSPSGRAGPGSPCVLVSPAPSLEALAWGRAAGRRRGGRTGRAGRWSTWSTGARTTSGVPACSPSGWSRRCAAAAGWCACSTARAGPGCWPACAAARRRAASAATRRWPTDGDQLVCRRCGTVRPQVCLSCGGTGLQEPSARGGPGARGARGAGPAPVVEVSAGTDGRRWPADPQPTARSSSAPRRCCTGSTPADVVAFLDFDQELLAPRYRAAEEALGLLVRAARLVGGPARGRAAAPPDPAARPRGVQAALLGDPARVAEAELARRRLLGYPPLGALAAVSGAGAAAFMARFGSPDGSRGRSGRATASGCCGPTSTRRLLDALAATPRPPGRLRVAVDPLRL